MSGTKYLLDTCFILGLYNQNSDVVANFGNIIPHDCYFSVINRIELLGYADITTQDEIFLKELLSVMNFLPICADVEQETINLRKQHKIKLPDSMILATAKVHNLELLTLDKKLQKYIQH